MTYIEKVLSLEIYAGLTEEELIGSGLCIDDFFCMGIGDICSVEDDDDDDTVILNKCTKCWNSEIASGLCMYSEDQLDRAEDIRRMYRNNNPQLPERAEETALTFNYAVLSAEMGDFLKRKEQQLKNEYMNFTANCGAIFAEAQEKLAKNGFGDDNGLFRKWIASMGFSKTTVYRMIDIHKFRLSQIGTDEGQAFFDALPKTLQADISAPSAPPELVEQVMNGDITTHKDYIALKKELEEKRNDYLNAVKEKDKLENKRVELSLEKEIKELESRPIEVESIPDEEIDRRARAKVQKILDDKDREWNERLEEVREEYRQRGKTNNIDEQLTEIYEQFHDKAKYALKDCAAFISSSVISDKLRKELINKFRNFTDLLELYFDDLGMVADNDFTLED